VNHRYVEEKNATQPDSGSGYGQTLQRDSLLSLLSASIYVLYSRVESGNRKSAWGGMPRYLTTFVLHLTFGTGRAFCRIKLNLVLNELVELL
jgi:hypothetical protein